VREYLLSAESPNARLERIEQQIRDSSASAERGRAKGARFDAHADQRAQKEEMYRRFAQERLG
jgi:hypothetical protein